MSEEEVKELKVKELKEKFAQLREDTNKLLSVLSTINFDHPEIIVNQLQDIADSFYKLYALLNDEAEITIVREFAEFTTPVTRLMIKIESGWSVRDVRDKLKEKLLEGIVEVISQHLYRLESVMTDAKRELSNFIEFAKKARSLETDVVYLERQIDLLNDC